MLNNKVNFRKQRDFAGLFWASYVFIRQEFRVLSKPLFLIVAPCLLALSVAALFMPEIPVPDFVPDLYQLMTFSLGYFIVQVTIYASIKEYVENDGHIRLSKVRENILTHIIPASVWAILGSIILAVGICLFIVPGVYFWVGTLLAFPAMFFTSGDDKMSLRRCFSLVRGRWWFTVALVVVFTISVFAVQTILLAPYYLLTHYIKSNIALDVPAAYMKLLTAYRIIISNIIILLNAFLAVLLSFHYFSQLEKLDA